MNASETARDKPWKQPLPGRVHLNGKELRDESAASRPACSTRASITRLKRKMHLLNLHAADLLQSRVWRSLHTFEALIKTSGLQLSWWWWWKISTLHGAMRGFRALWGRVAGGSFKATILVVATEDQIGHFQQQSVSIQSCVQGSTVLNVLTPRQSLPPPLPPTPPTLHQHQLPPPYITVLAPGISITCCNRVWSLWASGARCNKYRVQTFFWRRCIAAIGRRAAVDFSVNTSFAVLLWRCHRSFF